MLIECKVTVKNNSKCFDGGRGMVNPAMLIEKTNGIQREHCLIENQMASDLSGLSARPLNFCTAVRRNYSRFTKVISLP